VPPVALLQRRRRAHVAESADGANAVELWLLLLLLLLFRPLLGARTHRREAGDRGGRLLVALLLASCWAPARARPRCRGRLAPLLVLLLV
jgi:hypothetical protein